MKLSKLSENYLWFCLWFSLADERMLNMSIIPLQQDYKEVNVKNINDLIPIEAGKLKLW